MRALIPRHVIPGHDNRPFKLMCDDFQPTNMIVNNEQELKIVAVLDWEWSYTAPIQLANTTPTWLLIESPNAWGSIDERLARFNRHLELYTRIMVEEEPKILGEGVPEDQKPSTLLRACQKGGRQWFHFIMLRGFNGPTCVPFIKLREETEDWDELVAAIPAEDVDAFVQKKMTDLQEYGKQLPEMQERYREALRGDSTERNAFLYKNLDVLSLDSQRREWLSW